MRVDDIIKKLQTFPPDAVVWVNCYEAISVSSADGKVICDDIMEEEKICQPK